MTFRNIKGNGNVVEYLNVAADPSGRAVRDVGLRPLACWGCGFECRPVMDICLV